MTRGGLTFEAPLYRVRRGMAMGFDPHRPANPSAPRWKPTAMARALALGYRIRRAVETQEVASFSAAARAMRITPQRVSRLVALTLLPRGVQEAVLGCQPPL